jgi:two-component system cell cycle response regulator DivK
MAVPTILVVDDNATNLKLACYVLESEGYRVLRAGNASEAMSVVAQSRPDLILMDIQMPGMDGLAMTRILKADPTLSSIRIVALTSFAMTGDEHRARTAGCDGYITKPIDAPKFPFQVTAFLPPGSTTPIADESPHC